MMTITREATLRGNSLPPRSGSSTCTAHKVQYQGNDGYNQQDMNQTAGYMEYDEAQYPANCQHDK